MIIYPSHGGFRVSEVMGVPPVIDGLIWSDMVWYGLINLKIIPWCRTQEVKIRLPWKIPWKLPFYPFNPMKYGQSLVQKKSIFCWRFLNKINPAIKIARNSRIFHYPSSLGDGNPVCLGRGLLHQLLFTWRGDPVLSHPFPCLTPKNHAE